MGHLPLTLGVTSRIGDVAIEVTQFLFLFFIYLGFPF